MSADDNAPEQAREVEVVASSHEVEEAEVEAFSLALSNMPKQVI